VASVCSSEDGEAPAVVESLVDVASDTVRCNCVTPFDRACAAALAEVLDSMELNRLALVRSAIDWMTAEPLEPVTRWATLAET